VRLFGYLKRNLVTTTWPASGFVGYRLHKWHLS